MEEDVLKMYVEGYFKNPKSFLATEAMKLYLAADVELAKNLGVKVQCLELLRKIEG